jgi:hypothetical protein
MQQNNHRRILMTVQPPMIETPHERGQNWSDRSAQFRGNIGHGVPECAEGASIAVDLVDDEGILRDEKVVPVRKYAEGDGVKVGGHFPDRIQSRVAGLEDRYASKGGVEHMNAAAIVQLHVNGSPKLAGSSSSPPRGTAVPAIGPEPRHRKGLIVEDVDIPEIVHQDIANAAEDFRLIPLQDTYLKNPSFRAGDLRAQRIGSKEGARAERDHDGPD